MIVIWSLSFFPIMRGWSLRTLLVIAVTPMSVRKLTLLAAFNIFKFSLSFQSFSTTILTRFLLSPEYIFILKMAFIEQSSRRETECRVSSNRNSWMLWGHIMSTCYLATNVTRLLLSTQRAVRRIHGTWIAFSTSLSIKLCDLKKVTKQLTLYFFKVCSYTSAQNEWNDLYIMYITSS